MAGLQWCNGKYRPCHHRRRPTVLGKEKPIRTVSFFYRTGMLCWSHPSTTTTAASHGATGEEKVTDYRSTNSLLSQPQNCVLAQAPRLCACAPIRYTPPSMRSGMTVQRRGACDGLLTYALRLPQVYLRQTAPGQDPGRLWSPAPPVSQPGNSWPCRIWWRAVNVMLTTNMMLFIGAYSIPQHGEE